MKNIVNIKNLHFSYPEKPIFRDLTCAMPEGITCLTGPSGLGKTTLLRLIADLERPQKGKISRPRAVSMMFQEDRLLEGLSAEENLMKILPRAQHSKVTAALSELLPEPEALQKPVRELSGGMSRRVALARAILAQAPLVLLDEPFSGLDRDTKLRAIEFIKRELGGRSAIVITHDTEDIELLGAQELRLGAEMGIVSSDSN